jgi:hypothetical protein
VLGSIAPGSRGEGEGGVDLAENILGAGLTETRQSTTVLTLKLVRWRFSDFRKRSNRLVGCGECGDYLRGSSSHGEAKCMRDESKRHLRCSKSAHEAEKEGKVEGACLSGSWLRSRGGGGTTEAWGYRRLQCCAGTIDHSQGTATVSVTQQGSAIPQVEHSIAGRQD